jgi:hypothetical protein
MSRRIYRHPEPSLKRLLERRELMKQLVAMPDNAKYQQDALRLCIASLENKIRAKLKAEPQCWMVKPNAAKLDAEPSQQADPDMMGFQTLGNRPSWLRSSQF